MTGRFKYSEATRRRARKLRAEGWTYAAIGREIGASETAVSKWCDEERRAKAIRSCARWNRVNRPAYCKRHGRRHSGNQCRECRKERGQVRRVLASRWWAEGVPAAEIATRLGMTLYSFYAFVDKARAAGFPFAYRKTLPSPKHKQPPPESKAA